MWLTLTGGLAVGKTSFAAIGDLPTSFSAFTLAEVRMALRLIGAMRVGGRPSEIEPRGRTSQVDIEPGPFRSPNHALADWLVVALDEFRDSVREQAHVPVEEDQFRRHSP